MYTRSLPCCILGEIQESDWLSSVFKERMRERMRDVRLPMSALATVAQKSFNGKFTAKIDFPIRHFMLPLLMLTLEVLSLSMLVKFSAF